MGKPVVLSGVTVIIAAVAISCADSSLVRSFRVSHIARVLGFSDQTHEKLTLKGVHLDGVGLLNHDVLVSGRIQIIGPFDTYIVIEEDKVRMLIDLSPLGGAASAEKLVQGKLVEVAGKVQAGDNGHVYLVATAVTAG